MKQPRILTAEQAYLRATADCARAEHCRYDLMQRMLRGGLSREDCEDVLDRLEDEGYVCSLRYAQAYAHDKLRYERWGRQKIRQGLAAKRIPEADIRAALDGLDEEEYRTILGEVVRRKLAATTAETDFQRTQKVARYAISRGFEPALVFPLVGSTDPFEE